MSSACLFETHSVVCAQLWRSALTNKCRGASWGEAVDCCRPLLRERWCFSVHNVCRHDPLWLFPRHPEHGVLSNNTQYFAATTLFRIPLHSMMPPVQHPYAPSTAPLSPQHCNAPRVHASLLSTLMACSMHAQNLCGGPAAGLRLHPLHTRTHTHGRSRPPGVHATAGALLHRLKNQGLWNQIKTSISSLANVEFTYTLSGSWSSGMLG